MAFFTFKNVRNCVFIIARYYFFFQYIMCINKFVLSVNKLWIRELELIESSVGMFSGVNTKAKLFSQNDLKFGIQAQRHDNVL